MGAATSTTDSENTLIISSNTFWSVFNFRRGLIRALAAEGTKVIVVAPEDNYRSSVEELGCKTVSIRMSLDGLNPFQEFRTIFEYVSIFRRYSPNLCLLFTVKPNLYGSLASIVTGVPVFCTITGLGTPFIAGGLFSRVAEWSYRLIRRVPKRTFFQNPDDLRLFSERGLTVAENTLLVSGSGVNLEKFCFSTMSFGGPLIFLFVGRVLRDKGIYEFVEAASQVQREFKNVEFWVAGDLTALNRTALNLNTIDAWRKKYEIKFLGEIERIGEVMKSAHCVVLPSYREGLPRSLMEACAVGRPVITTDVPGCREIVEPMSNGLLCRVCDSQDLAEKMINFIKLTRAEKELMGRRSRTRAERLFDEDAVIDSYRRQIQKVLATKDDSNAPK